MAVKTEDELLDLIAKAYSLNWVDHVKDFIAENVIYDTHWFDSPMVGREKFCVETERWFLYNRLYSVSVDTVRYSASEDSMGYVSLEVDYDEVKACIIIESESGMITRIYEVKPVNTGRRQFESLKKRFFLPRLAVAPEQAQAPERPKHRKVTDIKLP
jgi:hypothetical protein